MADHGKAQGGRKLGTFMEHMNRGDGCLYNRKMVSEGKNSIIWGLRGKQGTDCAGTYRSCWGIVFCLGFKFTGEPLNGIKQGTWWCTRKKKIHSCWTLRMDWRGKWEWDGPSRDANTRNVNLIFNLTLKENSPAFLGYIYKKCTHTTG